MFLRNDRPSNPRRFIPPTVFVLCQCTECIQYSAVDSFGNVTPGCRITTKLAKRHAKQESPMETARLNLRLAGGGGSGHREEEASTEDEWTDTDEHRPAAETEQPANAQSRRQQKKADKFEKGLSAQKYNECVHKVVADINSTLKVVSAKGLSEVFRKTPLVFTHRPTISSTEPPILVLVQDDPANISFLRYEQAVQDSIKDMESYLRERCLDRLNSVRVKLLLEKLKEEETEIIHVKETEWQRQLKEIPVFPPGITVIDPGQHI